MQATATVNYHVRDAKRQEFRFDAGGVIGRLDSPDLIATKVTVRDVREWPGEMQFGLHGIEFVRHASTVAACETTAGWESQYEDELSKLLTRITGATEVIVFDHTVRVDDPSALRRPARNVHTDYSPLSAEQRLVDLIGERRADAFRHGQFGFVNVWRPLEGPVVSSPLGFIHPDTMSVDDWMTIDLVYPDRRGQILGVARSPSHKWFYQSAMSPEDVVIFNVYDSAGRPALGHSALDLEGDRNQVRKSIESRTLVRYA